MVRGERPPAARPVLARAVRLGGPRLVADPGSRAQGRPRGSGAVRPDAAGEDRGTRPEGSFLPAVHRRQPGRPAARNGGIHHDAERGRRHPRRRRRRPPRKGALPRLHRGGRRAGGSRLARTPRPRRRLRADRRDDLPVLRPRTLGAAGARGPAAALPRPPRRKGVPPFHRPPHRRRRRAGPGAAPVLRRRAGLGDLHGNRIRLEALGPAVGVGTGCRDRPPRRRGLRLAAPGKGVPPAGQRHPHRIRPLRGRPRLDGETRQGEFPRPRRPAGAARAGPRAPAELHDPRRPGGGGPREGADPRRGAGAGICHQQQPRLQRRKAHRLWVPAGAERGPGIRVEIEYFGERLAATVAAEPLLPSTRGAAS